MSLNGHSQSVKAVAFSSDGKLLVSGGDDGSARLWDVKSGEALATLVSLNGGADWLVVTPDGLFDGTPGAWGQILWRFSPNNIFDVAPVEIFFNDPSTQAYWPISRRVNVRGRRRTWSKKIAGNRS